MTDTLPWPGSLDQAGVFVPGAPQPQGSHKAFIVGGYARITESNRKLNPWRADIHQTVRDHIGVTLIYPTGPVELWLRFIMPRRKQEPKRVTPPHIRAPDLDKLARGCIDALIGLIVADDAQVSGLHATKRTAGIGEQPGVYINWRPGE